MTAWIGEFKSKEDVEREFEEKIPEGAAIHIAWYGYGSYEGDSFVLFEDSGKLYEVNASHCSCFGIEGQWTPEETTVEALKHRLDNATYGLFAPTRSSYCCDDEGLCHDAIVAFVASQSHADATHTEDR
jgi:hypothetical protein